ncbi:MAG: hypothetical protein AAF355_11780 [Myxococcota bacterium]
MKRQTKISGGGAPTDELELGETCGTGLSDAAESVFRRTLEPVLRIKSELALSSAHAS